MSNASITLEKPPAVTAAFGQDANRGARAATAGRYVLHTLGNIARITREADARALTGAFAGTPAIIAAAGPSLDRNIHEIAPVLDRALLIACDTAARPLVFAGAEPHFVVAIDGSQSNAAHLAGLPLRRARLVAEGSLHHSAFSSFENRTFFCKISNHEPWPWLRSIGIDRHSLDAWGSVLTTAFALALDMGCDPIVFAGADLAFTDGRPYCRGTTFESQWASWVAGGESYEGVWSHLAQRWALTDARDLHGRATVTAPHLIEFRNWIERRAGDTFGTIVNATGAGILSGRNITQTTAHAALHARPALDAGAVAERIASLHRVTDGELVRALDAITEIAAGGHDDVVARWMAFAEGRISPAAVRTALATPEQAAWAAAHERFLSLEIL